MGDATPRRYGGAGFVINYRPVVVSVSHGRQSINGLSLLDERARRDLADTIERFRRAFLVPVERVTVHSIPPQHVGLGTKTALTLGVLKSLQLLNRIAVTNEDLQVLSGRGGASGVGVHGFFKGGFIVDAGHKSDPRRSFLPSSFREGFDIPPLITRVKIPTRWRFALFIPKGSRFSGRREMRFFGENTPIPKREALDTLALMYHGVVPAIQQADLAALSSALAEIHNRGFKRRELENQPGSVRAVFAKLADFPKCAAGLSSMGPLIYVATTKSEDLVTEFERLARREKVEFLGVFSGRNRGFDFDDGYTE